MWSIILNERVLTPAFYWTAALADAILMSASGNFRFERVAASEPMLGDDFPLD